MSEEEKQESQKTVVAFIAGLLIGGLLVWVFGGTPQDEATQEIDNGADTETPASDDDENGTTDDNTDNDTTDTSNGDTSDDTGNDAQPVAELPTGDGAVTVNDQPAGARVKLDSATFPTDEGWIGVRDYVDGQLTGLLGVARYSKEQGLVPEEIILQRATRAGNTYAVVFYSESGDREFSLADDVQIGGVMDTFTAQ